MRTLELLTIVGLNMANFWQIIKFIHFAHEVLKLYVPISYNLRVYS